MLFALLFILWFTDLFFLLKRGPLPLRRFDLNLRSSFVQTKTIYYKKNFNRLFFFRLFSFLLVFGSCALLARCTIDQHIYFAIFAIFAFSQFDIIWYWERTPISYKGTSVHVQAPANAQAHKCRCESVTSFKILKQ